MGIIRLQGFSGENRALHPKALPDAVGTVSRNQKPGRGDLRPWKSPSTVASVPAGRQTIYRMGRDVASDSEYWLSWTGTVHAVRGFDAEDTTERTYYTGDGAPKVTNNIMALATAPYPTSNRPMGLPAPKTAPLVATLGVAAVPDVGKHKHFIKSYVIDTLVVGDMLKFTFEDETEQIITLTGGTGGVVTAATLTTQINALTGLAAVEKTTDYEDGAGVLIVSETISTPFSVYKKNGTFSDYDPAVVTFTAWGSASYAASVSAQSIVQGYRYKIETVGGTDFKTFGAPDNAVGTVFRATKSGSGSSGTGTVARAAFLKVTTPGVSMNPGHVLSVVVGDAPPVSVTVYAGSGTYPEEVTTDSLASALDAVDGLVAISDIESDGVTHYTLIESAVISSTVGTAFSIRTVNPATSDYFYKVASSTEITQPVSTSVTYFYAYTFVNDWGWESAPSPPSEQNDRASDAHATISGFEAAPAGNYQINRIRIYRTQVGSSGSADFFFLREVTYGTTSTDDDNRELGEAMPTTTWLTPPDDLSFLTSMWNGMLAGISGNSVRFCEAYTPYAWPIAYDVVPPDSKPVALGVFGQSLLVLTTGRPLLVMGSSPESMDQQLVEIPQGCIAPRSVASMGSGVAWASEDGLCWFGAGGARVLTAGLMMREDWQALVPSSIIGRFYEGLYFGSYDDGSGRKAFMIDPTSPTGLYFLDAGYSAMHFDDLKDQLYVVSGASVQKWDAGSLLTARFRSKQFRAPKPINFSAAEVVADTYPLTFRVFADGDLKYTHTVTSRVPFRLPSGFLALDWQIEIEGTSAVQSAALATSIAELAEI